MVDSVSIKAVGITAPILPYIPPENAQIMDLISNAYGVTAPAIEDAGERMQAYLKLYQALLGSTYDTFKIELDSIIAGAKRSGKIRISSNASSIIQSALSEAVENGYEAGESIPAIDTWQGAVNRTNALGIYNSAGAWQNAYNTANSYFNSYNKSMGYHYCFVYSPTDCAMVIIPQVQLDTTQTNYLRSYIDQYGRRWFVKKNTNNQEVSISPIYIEFYALSNGQVGAKTGNTTGSVITETWAQNSIYADFGVDATARTSVSAQTQEITDALSTGEVVPITANTDTENMSGDIVITIPAITIFPAETVNDLPTVQENLGVIPSTPDTTAEQLQAIIENLQEAQAEKYGDVGDYSINLTEYFPFCIPFDIGNVLALFVAEPEAPQVTFILPIGYDTENGIIFEEFEMDLSEFDAVALWCRRGMLLVFIVGLAMVTRQIFLRG